MGSRWGVVSRSRSCGMTPEAAVTTGALGLLGTGLAGDSAGGSSIPGRRCSGRCSGEAPAIGQRWLSPSTTVPTRNTRRGSPRFSPEKGSLRRSSASDSASSNIRGWPPPSTGPGTGWRTTASRTGPGVTCSRPSGSAQICERCQEVIVSITSKAPRYYRPAVGIRNPVVHRAARAVGLQIITWTQAARDGAFAFDARKARRMGEPGDTREHPGPARRLLRRALRLARRDCPESPRAASVLEGPRIALLDPGRAAHCSLTSAARVFSASRTKGLFLSVT